MKVHELKEILNNYDDTADVFFFTGYSTINSLILTPTGEEFKQAKLNLNHWKNYDNLSRAEYFNLMGKKSPTSIGGAMNCPIIFQKTK